MIGIQLQVPELQAAGSEEEPGACAVNASVSSVYFCGTQVLDLLSGVVHASNKALPVTCLV